MSLRWHAMPDRPGGIRQQFKAVLPMVESMLDGLKQCDPCTPHCCCQTHC